MDDLISREKAIDAHYDYCNKHPDAGFPVWSLKILENLPSAQPEKRTEERTETHACDLIDRQAVIEINRSYHGQMPNEVNHRIWKEINELPSAQPEIIRCKECKYAHITYGGEVKYCDIWFPDESHYMDTDNYCSFAERRTDEVQRL